MNIPLYYTLKQCDEVTVQNITMPYITSLHSCLNRVVGEGYSDNFKSKGRGIQSRKTSLVYMPEEFRIVNYFRFEGNTNPADNVIMYVIETGDGLKGTMVTSYNSTNEQVIINQFAVEAGQTIR
jgi:hypothetical protein